VVRRYAALISSGFAVSSTTSTSYIDTATAVDAGADTAATDACTRIRHWYLPPPK
jgi:hypothetical protein